MQPWPFTPLPKTMLALLVLPCVSLAAPLDALLHAYPSDQSGTGEITIAYEFMNEQMDVFGIEDLDTPVDYQGGHLQGGLALTDRLWLDGALWQRSVRLGSFEGKLNTWQMAGQYLMLDGSAAMPALALRAGLWGNTSHKIDHGYNLLSGETRTSRVQIDNPHDQQIQVDLITSLRATSSLTLSGFITAGYSQVDFADASATATYQGCFYNLILGSSSYIGTLAGPCNADIVITRYMHPYDADDINIHQEMRYSASYYQAGMSGRWQSGRWNLQGGYLYATVDRNVDDIIRARGNRAFTTNQTVLMDIGYTLSDNLSWHVSGQYFHHQLGGEIPVAYNSATASQFDHAFGLLGTGLVMQFR